MAAGSEVTPRPGDPWQPDSGPVHWYGADDWDESGWYFWTPSGESVVGPYDSREDAELALAKWMTEATTLTKVSGT